MKRVYFLLAGIAAFFSVTVHAQSESATAVKFVIPPYFIANSEAYIKGPFDGDGSNTIVRFENARAESFEARPVIESKNQLLIKVPETAGRFELVIAEEGNNAELFVPVNIVRLKMDYENITRPGKSFFFYLSLLGTESLEEDFNFSVQNKSPHIISIQGGNYQKVKVKGTPDGKAVQWQTRLTGLGKGEFIILGTVEQPFPNREVTGM